MQICRSHRISVHVVGNDDLAQTLFQILHIVGKTEDRHDLRCHRNDKMILPDKAVHLAAQTNHDISKNAVIHVQTTFPDDLSRINI